jgi:hypothetical protein
MSETVWQKTKVSLCETHHIFNQNPLYTERFHQVLKYHAPGLAPAKDQRGAFHIDIQGRPAYAMRFLETFGFYEGLAAVRTKSGWFHIRPDGREAYPESYAWCGNFQEGLCPVKNAQSYYFHIDEKGQKRYRDSYRYVGDFKDGFAVVCNEAGLHTHIDEQGRFIHEKWFQDLDVFHKGFARARNSEGWYHIDKKGDPLYSERYVAIEPFYNGVARVEKTNGSLLTIDVEGKKIAELRSPLQKAWQSLSGQLVGFWGTETIAAAVRLQVFACLPGNTAEIAFQLKLSPQYLERLLRGLWELDLIYFKNDVWQLTEKGVLLTPQNNEFLSAAAIMWSDVNGSLWKELPAVMRQASYQHPPLFKATAADEKLKLYHQAIDGYAREDFCSLDIPIDWRKHPKIIGLGRTAKVWLEKILGSNVEQQAVLLGEEYVLKYAEISPQVASRYTLKVHNASEPWPEIADAILLPKVLHYWQDKEVLAILKHARQALLAHGKIYIVEMLLDKSHPNGSLLDLNMLAESGGQLRFLSDWERLFDQSQLIVEQNIALTPWLNLLVLASLIEH